MSETQYEEFARKRLSEMAAALKAERELCDALATFISDISNCADVQGKLLRDYELHGHLLARHTEARAESRRVKP